MHEKGHETCDEEIRMLDDEEIEEVLSPVTQAKETKIKVAVDSGAVASVIHPDDLPDDVEVTVNDTGGHFVGPKGERIKKFGSCKTRMKGKHGDVNCNWQMAEVTRPLNSVSQMCGPADHHTGNVDVLFNNKRSVVVPPGVVEKIIQAMAARGEKPLAEYERSGNLYVADMTLSSFTRRGAQS